MKKSTAAFNGKKIRLKRKVAKHIPIVCENLLLSRPPESTGHQEMGLLT